MLKSAVGEALWFAFFRANIQFAVMRCARCLCEPTTRDWERIDRGARYLRWTAPIVSGEPVRITCSVDSDWAEHHGYVVREVDCLL